MVVELAIEVEVGAFGSVIEDCDATGRLIQLRSEIRRKPFHTATRSVTS